MEVKNYDLDKRLIDFAVNIIEIAELLPNSFAGNHLGGQLIRSGTAPALHYGEAQSAESRNDFIHKMKVGAKELRETFNCLLIIKKKEWIPNEKIDGVLNENNQLISIFVKSISTAQNNNQNKKKPVE